MIYSRRQFLKYFSLGASSALLLNKSTVLAKDDEIKISEIEVYPVIYPMVGRFKFFEDPRGEMQGRAAAIVKITASNGVIGWGESIPIPRWSYETLETVTSTLLRYLRPILIGQNVFDLTLIHEIMDRYIASSFSPGQPIAKAGIDIALHDLIGKIENKNLPQIWEKIPCAQIKLSWTLNPKNLEDLDELIDEGWRNGFRNFNVKVAPDLDYDLELCRQVKKRVPDGFLWADANGGYDINSALQIAPKLADIGVNVLEQPLKANEISGYQALKKQKALPILMDEGIVSPKTLSEFIKLKMIDGVAMKPARCGGLVSAKKQIEILLDHDMILLASGLTDPDISLAASLALYGAFDYKLPAALNGPQFITKSVLDNPFVAENGFIRVPTDPGLGINVNEDKIKEIEIEVDLD
jgi:L-alanine-DL-glutamate epimerase-like enolase superfamily enzyme